LALQVCRISHRNLKLIAFQLEFKSEDEEALGFLAGSGIITAVPVGRLLNHFNGGQINRQAIMAWNK
jgi:hypothetical protein